ncbi:hypothetical protein BDK88_0062 [Natrinema hispanicum]|uniref:Uncharacterized protein n=1 Tax=Natrinema hispanicum TaxID=392421 RepID=A0A482YDJ2_9EURY|nr:hypothetical protein BDK88_0062 [Natrinema hispanicum]
MMNMGDTRTLWLGHSHAREGRTSDQSADVVTELLDSVSGIFLNEKVVLLTTIVTTETTYTPIAQPSCDRVCIDFQWLLLGDSKVAEQIHAVAKARQRSGHWP